MYYADAGSGTGGAFCCLAVVGLVVLSFILTRRRKARLNATMSEGAPIGPVASSFDGFSTGLNASALAPRRPAVLTIGADFVAIGRQSVVGGPAVERFGAHELLSVSEGRIDKPGVEGFLANTNAQTNIGRALGWSVDDPGLLLCTRRGDIDFTVKPRDRAQLRQAHLAIHNLLARRQF